MEEGGESLIVDLGTGFLKAGFAGEGTPPLICPTVLGTKRFGANEYFGNEAMSKRAMLKLDYPIDHGIVQNWTDLEKLFRHTFEKELNIDPKERSILITEATLNPTWNREKMAEMIFEKFEMPALFIALQAHVSLYAAGRVSGIVFESGDGVSQVLPVYDGYPLKHATNRLDLAGRDLNENLQLLLTERGFRFSTAAEKEMVRDLKEKHCFVAYDYDQEYQNAQQVGIEKKYELPDGQVLSIDTERFRCPEILFSPTLHGLNHDGIHGMIYNSVNRCDREVKKEMYENIVISGGTTKLPGLAKRIKKEVTRLAPSNLNVRLISIKNPNVAAWKGASMLASLSTFKNMWVSKSDYAEYGNSVIHQKCF